MMTTNAANPGNNVTRDDPLAGLDDVPWGTLMHAYGSAEDVPGLLRAIATGNAEDTAEAVHELFGNIWHQGTIYEATPYAVPFLARLAAAGMATAGLVFLLGSIAEDTGDAFPGTVGSAGAVVASQAGLVGPLLHSADEEVRGAVGWALAQSGPADIATPFLRGRWDAEEVSSVRATLLRAVVVLDPAQGTTLADQVLTIGTATERLVASWALILAGRPWNSDLRDAAMAWLTDGLDLNVTWWGDDTSEPFAELLLALTQRGDLALATELAAASLSQGSTPDIRKRTLWAVSQLADDYRVTAADLGPGLAPLIADEALRGTALGLLQGLDPSSPADDFADRALIAAVYNAANIRGPGRDADTALGCLIAFGDPRAPDLLSRDLAHRSNTLSSVVPASDIVGADLSLGFDQGLLDAIRSLLGTSSIAPANQAFPRPALPEGVISSHMLMHILQLLASWGPQAAPAMPEVVLMLPHDAFSARVLVAIGNPGPEAIAAVRLLASPDTEDLWARLTAAGALRELSGETAPLLAAVRDSLDQERQRETAARLVRGIRDPPRWLVPALNAALEGGGRNPYLRAEVSRTLCRLTGDISRLADLLQQSSRGLSGPDGGYTVLEAAREAGRGAEPLIPALSRFLYDETFCPHAAEAIVAAGLGDVDLETLAGHLVAAVGTRGGPNNGRALHVLRQIRPRDPTTVSRNVLARLHDFVERPERIINGMGKDKALRGMIRDFLEENEGRVPGNEKRLVRTRYSRSA